MVLPEKRRHLVGQQMTGDSLAQAAAIRLQRRYSVLSGRGSSALYVALRAVALRSGPGDVIVPDILCLSVAEAVLLAGFKPIFGLVTPDRLALDPQRLAVNVTSDTRAVIVAHLYGYAAAMDSIRDVLRTTAPDAVLIEDAVQGLGGHVGGQPIGSLGDLSFTSFDPTKIIGGRGGALLFDDPAWLDPIQAALHDLNAPPEVSLPAGFLPDPAARAYTQQLQNAAPSLLRSFNPDPANLDRILADWQTLDQRVMERNHKARWLYDRLRDLPLTLPDIRDGDAIWRYTFTTPTAALARWIAHELQRADLIGSALYPPLSLIYGQPTESPTNRTLNLWVDESADDDYLRRVVNIIGAAPYHRR